MSQVGFEWVTGLSPTVHFIGVTYETSGISSDHASHFNICYPLRQEVKVCNMSNLLIYSHRRFGWNLRWDSTANGAFRTPSTVLPRVTFLRFGRSFCRACLFRHTSAGWVELMVRGSASSSYSNLAGAPNYFEIIGRLPAAPRGWLELRGVAPCLIECPQRAHIHP